MNCQRDKMKYVHNSFDKQSHCDYPHLHQFSLKIGIDQNALIEAYKIEKKFHEKILNEDDPQKRKALYQEVYHKVHPIYEKGRFRKIEGSTADRKVMVFKKELQGKSIIDLGCGKGEFLRSIATNIEHKELVGVDIDAPELALNHQNIRFISADIIDFNFDKKFDIVFSDNVFEHIALPDIPSHITSIKKVMNYEGKLIIIMPNRLFGPHDVTRIIDCSYSNKISAQGTHLNESTYSEMITILKKSGFKHFKVIVPFPYLIGKLRIQINPLWVCWIETIQFY